MPAEGDKVVRAAGRQVSWGLPGIDIGRLCYPFVCDGDVPCLFPRQAGDEVLWRAMMSVRRVYHCLTLLCCYSPCICCETVVKRLSCWRCSVQSVVTFAWWLPYAKPRRQAKCLKVDTVCRHWAGGPWQSPGQVSRQSASRFKTPVLGTARCTPPSWWSLRLPYNYITLHAGVE